MEDTDLEVRLYWLVWARPEEILAARDFFDSWVLVGALRDAPAELLVSGRHASPERRALAVQRRRPRALPRHTPGDCVRGIRSAPHPQLRLVWILLLVENHRQLAELELLRLIGSAGPNFILKAELAAACAWGLARLGREMLCELRPRFATAVPSIRDVYCQALWHLGSQARGCQDWIGSYDSVWARAVLYRLEEHGWRLLLQRRAWPLWISRESLVALAELAFSLKPADRWYALRALLGWGPDFGQAEGLVKALARDPDPDLSEGAALLASHLGWLDARRPTREELAAKLYFEVDTEIPCKRRA